MLHQPPLRENAEGVQCSHAQSLCSLLSNPVSGTTHTSSWLSCQSSGPPPTIGRWHKPAFVTALPLGGLANTGHQWVALCLSRRHWDATTTQVPLMPAGWALFQGGGGRIFPSASTHFHGCSVRKMPIPGVCTGAVQAKPHPQGGLNFQNSCLVQVNPPPERRVPQATACSQDSN